MRDEGVIDSFFSSRKESIVSGRDDKFKTQGYAEIVNLQPTEFAELQNIRVWVTNVSFGRFFNDVARQNMQQDILKRVIMAKQAVGGPLKI